MRHLAAPPTDGHVLGHALHGVARKIEMTIMTLLMTGVVAVFLWMVSFAMTRADDARRLAEAVAMAETMAEGFSADPSGAHGDVTDAKMDLVATCSVSGEEGPSGMLLHASISVRRISSGDEVYSLESARYADGRPS